MIYEEATERALIVLNRMLEEDRVAVTRLCLDARVPCNDALADDPSVQVGHIGDDKTNGCDVGLLGVVNGICGTIDDGPKKGWGPVTAVVDMADGNKLVTRFERTALA